MSGSHSSHLLWPCESGRDSWLEDKLISANTCPSLGAATSPMARSAVESLS